MPCSVVMQPMMVAEAGITCTYALRWLRHVLVLDLSATPSKCTLDSRVTYLYLVQRTTFFRCCIGLMLSASNIFLLFALQYICGLEDSPLQPFIRVTDKNVKLQSCTISLSVELLPGGGGNAPRSINSNFFAVASYVHDQTPCSNV